MRQILNNFNILNRDYKNLNQKKKKILFFFSPPASLFLTGYLSQFSLALYIFFLLLSLTQFSKTALPSVSTHWDFSSLFFTQWPNFFLLHSSHQLTINASQLVLTFVHKRWLQFFSLESFSSKFNLLCWLLTHFSTSSFNELRQSVAWTMVQCTQQNNPLKNPLWRNNYK